MGEVGDELFQWVVRGVRRDLANAVVDAAARRRMKTGDLLNDIIQAALSGSPGETPPAPATSAPADETAPIPQSVADLARRVDLLEGARLAHDGLLIGLQNQIDDLRIGARQIIPSITPATKTAPRGPMGAAVAADPEALVIEGMGRTGRRLTAKGEARVREMHATGMSLKAIGRELGVSDNTAKRVVQAADRPD